MAPSASKSMRTPPSGNRSGKSAENVALPVEHRHRGDAADRPPTARSATRRTRCAAASAAVHLPAIASAAATAAQAEACPDDGHVPAIRRSAAAITSGAGGQPGISKSTGTMSATAPATPYPPSNTPQFSAQSPSAITTARLGRRLQRLHQRHRHVPGDGSSDDQGVGVAWRRDQSHAESLGVVDRSERGSDLELAAVARPGIDVADLQRAARARLPQAGGWPGDRCRRPAGRVRRRDLSGRSCGTASASPIARLRLVRTEPADTSVARSLHHCSTYYSDNLRT